jgi:predicted kinase
MPKLTMCIGLPGSGKSTWAYNSNTFVISSDYYLEQWAKEFNLTYQQSFEKYATRAQDAMYEFARTCVYTKANCIWDQTNLTIKSRQKKLKIFPDDYERHAVVFDPSMGVIQDRLRQREKLTGKHISLDVVNSMANSYEIPTKDEGFDSILFYYNTNLR